jgi:pentatricopeptide repeat protein
MGNYMKNNNDFLQEIETYVKAYVQPKSPKGFIPVVYECSFEKETAEQFKEMLSVVELIEKAKCGSIGRIFVGANISNQTSVAIFAKNGDLNKARDVLSKMCRELGLMGNTQFLCGVVLLPPQFQKQEVLLTDVQFKQVLRKVG